MDVWAEAQVLSSWTSIIYAKLLAFVTDTEWAPATVFPQKTQSTLKKYE